MNTQSHINDVIGVIIVNYRTADLVIAGLGALALERQTCPNLNVVLVDNDSGDGSADRFEQVIAQKSWGNWINLVRAEKNGGFAYGNNVGFENAKSWLPHIDYFWLLNPDTEVRPGATAALVNFVKENPRTIAGSCLEDRDGTKQVCTFNFPSAISEMCSGFGLGILDRIFANKIVPRKIPEVIETSDWMAGASLLFSNDVQSELGDMDADYFLYYEEVDYLLKAQKLGVHCWYLPESRIIHEVGASTNISDTRKKQPRKPKYWFDSRRRYFLKNHGRLYLFTADLLWMVGYSFWCLRKAVTNRDELNIQPPYFLYDFFRQSQVNPLNWGMKV